MRTIAVTLADIHAGHWLGLLNPETQLLTQDAEGNPAVWQPELKPVQKWLWPNYLEDLGEVTRLAQGDRVVLIVAGDVTWGARHLTNVISEIPADQVACAYYALLPWLALPNLDGMILVHGTEAHEFGRGAAPDALAEHIRAKHGLAVQSGPHYLVDVDGVTFDVAHHGVGPGARAWLQGNVLESYTRSLMLDELVAGREPPDVLVRAHYHDYARRTVRMVAGNREVATEAVILPSYSGMTHYAIKASRSATVLSCGLVAWEVVDGALVGVHPYWRRVDLRTRVKL